MSGSRAKKKLLSVILIIVFCFGLSFVFRNSTFINFLELRSLDIRMARANRSMPPPKDIVLVMVDEQSLEEFKEDFGRWPWPRAIWADVISYITMAGAKSIYFDILFSEPQVPRDKISGQLGDDDLALVEATRDSNITYHAMQLVEDSEDESNKNLLNEEMNKDFEETFGITGIKSKSRKYNKYYLPFKELYRASRGVGVVEFMSDNDGVYRRTVPLREYHDASYPILPLATFKERLQKAASQQDGYFFNEWILNINPNVIAYSISGLISSAEKLSINLDTPESDLLVPPSLLRGKHVFIGGSAVGIEDLKMTSLGNLPGVFLHAAFLENYISGKVISRLSNLTENIITLLLILLTVVVVLYIPLHLAAYSLPIFLMGLYSLFLFYLFDKNLIWASIIPILGAISAYILSVAYLALTEGKDKKFLKKAFSNYISPELIDEMYSKGVSPELGGVQNYLTAFFTDIQGFSTFSEKLNPHDLVELLNEYLGEMTNILLGEGGTLDKFEGDAIIAFFGAPIYFENHAARSLLVAERMQLKLAELRDRWKSQGAKWPEIVHNMRMRIGVNSGNIVTGNMGCSVRMNYTMMGDAVNLSARLESAAKQYGIFSHVSEFTKELVDSDFIFRELDTVKVVGKNEPITTFDFLGTKQNVSNDLYKLKETFEMGLELYKKKEWKAAIDQFNNSLEFEYKRFPELKDNINPSKVYIERCKEFEQNPPPADWDGVYVMTSK